MVGLNKFKRFWYNFNNVTYYDCMIFHNGQFIQRYLEPNNGQKSITIKGIGSFNTPNRDFGVFRDKNAIFVWLDAENTEPYQAQPRKYWLSNKVLGEKKIPLEQCQKLDFVTFKEMTTTPSVLKEILESDTVADLVHCEENWLNQLGPYIVFAVIILLLMYISWMILGGNIHL